MLALKSPCLRGPIALFVDKLCILMCLFSLPSLKGSKLELWMYYILVPMCIKDASCIAGCRLQYQFFPSPSFLDHLLWICCAYFSTNPPKTPSKKKETEMRSWVWLCASACLQIFAILLTSLLIPMSIPQYYMLRMLEICSFLDPDLSSKMQVTFILPFFELVSLNSRACVDPLFSSLHPSFLPLSLS